MPKIIILIFLNLGQIYILIKQVYVYENIYNRFRDIIVKFAKIIKTGDRFKDGVLVRLL